MDIEILGNVQDLQQQDGSLVIKTAGALARVTIYSPTVIRINISKDDSVADASFAVIQQPAGNFKFDESADSMIIDTGRLRLVISKAPLRFNFFTAGNRPISEDDPRFGTNWQGERVINYRRLFPGEKFIGLGEKTGNLDRRGTAYTNWNTDAVDYNTQSDPLYKTFPFFIGLHGGLTYGLFFDNTHKSYFDFGASTNQETSWFGADGGDMNYYFFGAQGVAEIIEDYTWLTGRMEMPPLWSLGYQQCRWSYMSAAEVLDIAQTFRKKQIPADVIYCDIDYMDDFKIFTWNKETFPDPQKLISQLNDIGFKLVTIVDPGIKIEKGYKAYDEGKEKGYFATYPDGENYTGYVWPGPCHFPDFFRDDVRRWWGRAFTALTGPGVAGFWNDMNEPAAWGQNIPWMVKFGEKFMPQVRNAYGMEMARATYDGTRKLLGNTRPFVLTRAAYAGTQRYSAVWTGDNTGTDQHMLLGQRMVNSLGITGMAMTGVDIGGFSGNPTPALMVRWNSLGTYTPMFRNHAIQGSKMREPWQWGDDNEQLIKKDIQQRYKLLPYLYSSFYQAHKTGLPVSRTLAIAYTDDEHVFDTRFQNQFMFGDALLVAPAESTRLRENVYLPRGSWYRLSSNKLYSGLQIVNVPAPLADLPVFVKAGAIIPMQGIIQNTGEKGDGILQLHIWRGNDVTGFVYYEDDGTSYDYERGIYYKRSIGFDPAKRLITLSAAEGSYQSKYEKIRLVLHGFGKELKLKDEVIENESGVISLKY